MHTFGAYYNTATKANLVFGVLINSVFNMGVSIFVLISGYFGVNSSCKKIVKFWLWVVFYSLLSIIVVSLISHSWSIKDLIKAVVPISSGRYWYMTSYMIILIFSRFINRIPEKLEKKIFERLILLMMLVFSLAPTFIYFHIMGDTGKGLMNMLLIYFIGRYLKIYGVNQKKVINIGLIVCLIGFIVNMITSFVISGHGVIGMFARDCSITIILGSIAVFLIFKNMKFQNYLINRIASHVMAVYLFEKAFRTVLGNFIDLDQFLSCWYFGFAILVYAFVVVIGCILIDIIIKVALSWTEKKLSVLGEKILKCIVRKLSIAFRWMTI